MDEMEMRNIIGGSGSGDDSRGSGTSSGSGVSESCTAKTAGKACKGKNEGNSFCTTEKTGGKCKSIPFTFVCWFG